MSYLSGNELKKEIRGAVPELGHRDLSVRYDGSYRVDVKKVVPLSKVEAVANKQESYSRCEASGEILSGGNTFVFVNYCRWNRSKDESYEVDVPQEFIEAVEEKVKELDSESWGSVNDWQSRGYHLPQLVKKANAELFEEYTDSDVSSVIGLVSNKSELVDSWLRNGPAGE